MKRILMLLVIPGVATVAARGQPYFEVPDVPTDLPAGGPTFLPWDIVDNLAGVYGLAASLPPNKAVDAARL